MTKKAPRQTRARILNAAVTLLSADGASQLVLDEVARGAEVSKGGLLHHFATKDALCRGLLDLSNQNWQESLNLELAKEPQPKPGSWSRAYIRASFHLAPEVFQQLRACRRVLTLYPELLAYWRQHYQPVLIPSGDDGLPKGRALMIRVACDGLWLGEVSGLALVPDSAYADIEAELLRLTHEADV